VRRGFGRSRGGLTTKLHAAVNEHGRLLRPILTPGHIWQYSEIFLTPSRTKQTSKNGILKLRML
jgi:transposase